jgi:hypothetical protein
LDEQEEEWSSSSQEVLKLTFDVLFRKTSEKCKGEESEEGKKEEE